MARCVIVGGAGIGDYPRARALLEPDDFLIYCDCGLRHRGGLGREADLIVGDFDSYERPGGGTEVIVLPREKDDTDTVFAAKEALGRGFDRFLLLGMVGQRFDHTFGNISLLLLLEEAGARAVLADDYSLMELVVPGTEALIENRYPFFSLLALGGDARGVTIRGAKYPLEGAEIACRHQYGISNEVLPGQTARVSLTQGRLLLVKVFDR